MIGRRYSTLPIVVKNRKILSRVGLACLCIKSRIEISILIGCCSTISPTIFKKTTTGVQNKIKAKQQKNTACGVQRRVQMRKNVEQIHYRQKPSRTNRTIQIKPIKCQYQPTARASLRLLSLSPSLPAPFHALSTIEPNATMPPSTWAT